MIAAKIGFLLFLMIVVPLIPGSMLRPLAKSWELSFGERLVFYCISGNFLFWACFQLLGVPLVLQEQRFLFIYQLFLGAALCLIFLGAVCLWRGQRTAEGITEAPLPARGQKSRKCLYVFLVLLVGIMAAMCMTAYSDGDDAYYVAVATGSTDVAIPYYVNPYTGLHSEIDMRHGMAPFPVMVAIYSKLTGLSPAICAHTGMPLGLVLLYFGVGYLFAKGLLKDKPEGIWLFMIFLELLLLFGGTSIYTPENFMMVRTAQGKAILAGIVLPFLTYLLYRLAEGLQHKRPALGVQIVFYGLVECVILTACLCSTLGVILLLAALGAFSVSTALALRKIRFVLPLFACMIPGIVYVILYLR